MHKDATIVFRCSQNLKSAIEEAAKSENRSITNFIETVMIEKLAQKAQNVEEVKTKTEPQKNSVLNTIRHEF